MKKNSGDRLGVWLFGALGGLATTVVTGARAMARGLAEARGLVSATPLVDGLPLASLDQLVFGGHEVRQGSPLESARALCPKTVALVQSIPNVNGAMFAMLPAGGDLGRHRDPFAGSLRYHLGLVTPNSDACRIVVDGQSYSWRDGEAVMFDETYIHWAENRTDVDRLIFFCDVERPLTSRAARAVNHWIKRTFVRASQTENEAGDKVGLLNRIFGFAYYARLPAKALKARNKYLYYAGKWLLLGGIVYFVFFYR